MNVCSKFFTIGLIVLMSFTTSANANKTLYEFRLGEYEKLYEQLKPDNISSHPVVLYYQGLAYINGYGVARDLKQGLKIIKKSGDLGYLPAQTLIAKYYLLKQNEPENAFKWFSKAAKQKDLESQMFVASAYLFGHGVKRHHDKARKYYIGAAKNGNAVAQYKLATHFFESKHSTNHKLGVLWLKKSANQNNPKAQFLLGQLYLEGKKVEPDYAIALELIDKAAKNNYTPAMHQIALMYQEGHGVEKNEELAKQWQEKAGPVPEEQVEEKKWITLKPEIAKKRAIAWIMNDKKPTTSFANFKLSGILWDWSSKISQNPNAQNLFPKMLKVKSTKIFAYKFDTIDPRTIKMSEMIDIIGKLKYGDSKRRLFYPKYSLPKDSNKPETLKKIIKLAELGYAPSQFKLAQLYQSGKQVEKDYNKALDLYLKAAAQRYSKAEYNLGIMYLKGIGVEKNYNTAFNWLEKSAFRGNSFAQFTLGLIFENGIVNKKSGQKLTSDKSYARNMYSLASTNNFPNAQYRLAELHLSGIFNEISSVSDKKILHQEIVELYESAVKNGISDAELSLAFYYVESNDPKKQKWAYKVASNLAESDNPFAIFLLAILYDRGIGVDEDRSEAIDLYQKSVLFDNPVADFILGTYYYNGDVVSKDEQKALKLLEKAAKKNQPFAQYNLAVIMHNTDPNSNFIPLLTKAEKQNYIKAKLLLADYQITKKRDSKNLRQAAKIYNQLAEKGYQEAQVKLGFMYEHGIHYKVNYQQAEYWYQQSAEQGNIYAQYFLANIYQVGKLGVPDFEKSSYWYQQAAKQNFTPAIIALGYINETMVYDYKEALKWYKRAAEKNNAIGQYNLGLMHEYGKGIDIDYKQALEAYKKATDLGYAPAIYNVAHLYLQGFGVEKNLTEARTLFQKAAKENNNYAQYQLAMIYKDGLGTKKDEKKASDYLKQSAANGNDLARIEIKRKKEAEAKEAKAKEKLEAELKEKELKQLKELKVEKVEKVEKEKQKAKVKTDAKAAAKAAAKADVNVKEKPVG